MAWLANSSPVHGALLLNRSAAASTSYHQVCYCYEILLMDYSVSMLDCFISALVGFFFI